METLLSDHTSYMVVRKPPFKNIERHLNATLSNLKNKLKLDDKTHRKLRSTDGTPPAIRGSIKHYKVSHSLRPIVTCIGWALYNTSKFLSDMLSLLQNHNGYSVSNSHEFTKEISNTVIQDDQTKVSFDVVSLLQSPLAKHVIYIKKKLENDASFSSRTKLEINDIVNLLDFVLSNNYFVYDDAIYKHTRLCYGEPYKCHRGQLMRGSHRRTNNPKR